MKLQTDFCATRCSIWGFALVGTEGGGLLGEAGGDWGRPGETISMLIPQFVAGEHRLFGGHESEDIWTICLIF